MLKLKILLLSSSLLLLFTACENDPTTNTSTTSADEVKMLDTLGFGMVSLKEISKSCAMDSIQCTTVELSYPLARGGNESAMRQINETIQRNVAAQIGLYGEDSDSISLSPQTVAKAFTAEYDNFVQQDDIMAERGWSSTVEGKVLYKSADWVTISLDAYANTGGAHPNYYTSLLNFDPTTGEQIDPKDYIADTDKFLKLVEMSFKKERGVDATAPLIEAGYDFDEGFVLPNEMGMTPKGMQLIYNIYEFGPYAAGMTTINIPNTELQGLIVKQ